MSGLYLFVSIAGTDIAIRTEEIEAVVRLSELSPVPVVAGHVAGLAALRSRVLTVIDAASQITGRPPRKVEAGSDENYAIVCDVSGHSYGILVDRVEDIRTITTPVMPICGSLSAAWKPYANGVVEEDGRPYFLLSLPSFLDYGLHVSAAA